MTYARVTKWITASTSPTEPALRKGRVSKSTGPDQVRSAKQTVSISTIFFLMMQALGILHEDAAKTTKRIISQDHRRCGRCSHCALTCNHDLPRIGAGLPQRLDLSRESHVGDTRAQVRDAKEHCSFSTRTGMATSMRLVQFRQPFALAHSATYSVMSDPRGGGAKARGV